MCVTGDRSHPTHVKTAPQCWWPICSTAIQYALLTRALQCKAQCGVFKCDECGMQCVDAVWRPRMRGQLAWRQIRQYRVTLGGRSWYDETLFSSSKATRTHQSTAPHWAFHPIRRPSPSPHWAADTFHSIIWRVVDLHLQSPMHGFFSLLSSLWPGDFKFDLIPVKNIACLSIQWVQIIFRQLVWSWSDIQLQMESQNKCWLVSICFANDLKSSFFNT